MWPGNEATRERVISSVPSLWDVLGWLLSQTKFPQFSLNVGDNYYGSSIHTKTKSNLLCVCVWYVCVQWVTELCQWLADMLVTWQQNEAELLAWEHGCSFMSVLSLHTEWCATIHVGTVCPARVLWRHKAYTSYAFRHLVQYIHVV